MGESKASKEWSQFSKDIRLDEKDWAVVEGLFQNHRNTVGVVSKNEFMRDLILAGAGSKLVQLKSSDPDALGRIAKTTQTFKKGK